MCVGTILWKDKHGVPRKDMQFRRGGMARIEPFGSVFHLEIQTVELHSYKKIIASMDGWTVKTPNPICRLFFKTDLLTDFAALCLTDFYRLEMHSLMLGIFDPACELLPSWTKELYLCTVAPLPSLWPPPPPPELYVQYVQYSMWLWGVVGGGGGCWILL